MIVSQEKFDEVLQDILNEMKGGELLDIPGVYEAVSEHFNNEVLERISEERQAEAEAMEDMEHING